MTPFVSLEKIGKRFNRTKTRFMPKAIEGDDEDEELLDEEPTTPVPTGGAREAWALRDISFRVDAGERVAIIGDNGAGKSLLLRIIAGTCLPSEGIVRGSGRVIAFNAFLKPLAPRRSGLFNIRTYARLLRVSKATFEQRVPEIAEFSGLGSQIAQTVDRYSTSMFPRLAAAAALHFDPDILLVDDSFAVGDASFREKLDRKLTELIGGGTTLIFASHKMSVLRSYCDRAIWLHEGRVREDGPADPVIRRYRAPATAGKLAAAASRVDDEEEEALS